MHHHNFTMICSMATQVRCQMGVLPKIKTEKCIASVFM